MPFGTAQTSESNRLELDVRLREEAAIEELRVRALIQLLEGDDDAEAASAPLAPVRAAEDVAALRAARIRGVRHEQIETADPRPADQSLSSFAEERHAAPLDVARDEGVVGRRQVLPRRRDMRVLVAAHDDRDIAG